MAGEHIPHGSHLLDIGCHWCELFHFLQKKQVTGTGLDPDASPDIENLYSGISFISDSFPTEKLNGSKFDVITALAVFEHIPTEQQMKFAKSCHDHLVKNGKAILTVPSPLVDYIINAMMFLRIIDHDMQGHQHYGFRPGRTVPLFTGSGFTLVLHRSFQFGLNNLFIFKKNNDPGTVEK